MNLNKLNGKIVECGIKKNTLAKELNISVQALNKKLKGATKISIDDAMKLCGILNITDNNEKNEIFLQ